MLPTAGCNRNAAAAVHEYHPCHINQILMCARPISSVRVHTRTDRRRLLREQTKVVLASASSLPLLLPRRRRRATRRKRGSVDFPRNRQIFLINSFTSCFDIFWTTVSPPLPGRRRVRGSRSTRSPIPSTPARDLGRLTAPSEEIAISAAEKRLERKNKPNPIRASRTRSYNGYCIELFIAIINLLYIFSCHVFRTICWFNIGTIIRTRLF